MTACVVGKPTFYRKPPWEAYEHLPGKTLSGVFRRGKYLLFRFETGAELVLHLGMSGSLRLDGPVSHERLRLEFGSEILRMNDPRRFGRAGCKLPSLGPEPLSEEFNPGVLSRAFRGRKAPIKALLLDQKVVAGLGNIYATEALYAARIRPGRAAGGLRSAQLERLTSVIKDILGQAVELGGSTLDDEAYVDPLGRPGRAQQLLKVYGRTECPSGHALKATARIIGGRRAWYCPDCQR